MATTVVSRPVLLSADALVPYLAKYSFRAADLTTWKILPDKQVGVQLGLHVQGHHEAGGHTQYVVVCQLADSGAVFLEWNAQRRLAQLREELHDPVKRELGVQAYNKAFKETPFAQRGGLKGTTIRLNNWCESLATSVNCGDIPPILVCCLLQFLEAPEPPEGLMLGSHEQGIVDPHDRSQAFQAAETSATASALTVENLQPGKWRVRGLNEDVLAVRLAAGVVGAWSRR